MCLGAGPDDTENLVSIQIQSLDRPVRRESVYRLSVFPICMYYIYVYFCVCCFVSDFLLSSAVRHETVK